MSHVRVLPLVVLGLSFTNQVAAAPKPIIEITQNIARDTLWSADAVYVVICKVAITGLFGDEMTLISHDLPAPRGAALYSFDGRLRAGQTYIYAHDD